VLQADRFGDFLVRVVCECGACREIQAATPLAGRRDLSESDERFRLVEM